MTNKQLLQDACSELAHVENILRMQTDFINLTRPPKEITENNIYMHYWYLYNALHTFYEVNQDLMHQLESVNNNICDIAEKLEAEKK